MGRLASPARQARPVAARHHYGGKRGGALLRSRPFWMCAKAQKISRVNPNIDILGEIA
jgi:hypothetical protein